MATTGNLKLAFGVHRQPKPAPAQVLRQVETEAQALAISISAGNHKLAYIAACTGKSVAYISRMQTGKRPIPNKLVDVLCAATGTRLLAQFLELQRALEGRGPVERLASMMREAA